MRQEGAACVWQVRVFSPFSAQMVIASFWCLAQEMGAEWDLQG